MNGNGLRTCEPSLRRPLWGLARTLAIVTAALAPTAAWAGPSPVYRTVFVTSTTGFGELGDTARWSTTTPAP